MIKIILLFLIILSGCCPSVTSCHTVETCNDEWFKPKIGIWCSQDARLKALCFQRFGNFNKECE